MPRALGELYLTSKLLNLIRRSLTNSNISASKSRRKNFERADPKGKDIGGNAVSAVLQTLANFK